MIDSEKTILIQDSQCRIKDFMITLNKKLKYNTCSDSLLNILKASQHMVQRLYEYKVFDSTVADAFKIEIEVKDSTATSDINLTTDAPATIGVITGETGDACTLANTLLDEVDDNFTVTHNYNYYQDGSTIYFYAYDVTHDWGDVKTVVTNSNVTVTITSLKNNLTEILDAWNCLTNTQICSIYKYVKQQTAIIC